VKAVRRVHLNSSVGHFACGSVKGNWVDGMACENQREFLTLLGDGNIDDGVAQLALTCIEYLKRVLEHPEAEAAGVFWKVQAKHDKYKASKIKSGRARSIQAPPIHFKVLWLFAMGDSDRLWTYDECSDFHIVAPPRQPMRQEMLETMMASFGATATDLVGWDRRLPSLLISLFFTEYCPRMCLGIPRQLLHYFAAVTIHSQLVMPNGKVYRKERGNPSGFPNTIRLNCVLQKVCNRLALVKTVQEDHPEFSFNQALKIVAKNTRSFYCGDDGINFAYTERGMDLLDRALANWEKMPWDVTIEGRHVFEGDDFENTPSFVSRTPCKIGGVWFHALCKPDKVVSKIFYCPNGPDTEFEARLAGIEDALVHRIVQQRLGKEHHPAIAWMDANFGTLSRARALGETLEFPYLE
jgi:hypothetical protein